VKAWIAAAIVLAVVVPPLRAEDSHLAAQMSGFTVRDMQGRSQNYHSLKGKPTVVIFFSTRCPMSNAFNYRRNLLYHDYRKRVRFIVVDSNSNESLEEVRRYAKDVGFDFPVYDDWDHEVADHFGVHSTTETFVLDSAGIMRYRGYIEDSPNPARTTTHGLRLAIDAVLAGRPVELAQTRAIGCAIRRGRP
jgi:peroxiredoxin